MFVQTTLCFHFGRIRHRNLHEAIILTQSSPGTIVQSGVAYGRMWRKKDSAELNRFCLELLSVTGRRVRHRTPRRHSLEDITYFRVEDLFERNSVCVVYIYLILLGEFFAWRHWKMNLSRTIPDSEVLFIGFNQDHGCFVCGTNNGFRIFNSDPFRETIRRGLPPLVLVRNLLIRF